MTTPAEIFSRLSAEISSASFVAGCIDTLGILAFIESLRSGRQRLLGVAALAAALFLAILAYQLGPESVMAAFCISLTFAGLLLHLRAQSHGAVHFPRLDLAIPLLAGAGVVASLLPPSSAGGATTALAPALFLLAAPITLVVAAKNLVVDRPHGEWTLFATAGYTGAAALQLATKMRFTDGVPGFIFNAGVLMLSLLALYLGEIAALRPQPSDQQAPMNAATDRTSIDNEAQARLFSQLSHELRSPLGVVLAGLGNLRRSSADPANDKRLGRMTQAAQRISNTLDDYSTLLDPQSGAGPLNLVAISPESPAQSALRVVQRDNPERFFDHAQRTGSTLFVPMDADEIEQALARVLAHAARSSAGPSAVLLQTEASEEFVRYHITHDTPKRRGTDSEGRQSIPHALVASDDAGLRWDVGLIVAARIAHRHGGRLEMEFRDQTTRFSLVLPQRPPSQPDAKTQP